MTNSEPDSNDETTDGERCECVELETLTRGEAWDESAFRDAGEATFGSPQRRR